MPLFKNISYSDKKWLNKILHYMLIENDLLNINYENKNNGKICKNSLHSPDTPFDLKSLIESMSNNGKFTCIKYTDAELRTFIEDGLEQLSPELQINHANKAQNTIHRKYNTYVDYLTEKLQRIISEHNELMDMNFNHRTGVSEHDHGLHENLYFKNKRTLIGRLKECLPFKNRGTVYNDNGYNHKKINKLCKFKNRADQYDRDTYNDRQALMDENLPLQFQQLLLSLDDSNNRDRDIELYQSFNYYSNGTPFITIDTLKEIYDDNDEELNIFLDIFYQPSSEKKTLFKHGEININFNEYRIAMINHIRTDNLK